MYRLHHLTGVINTVTGDHIPPIKSDPRWIAYQQWIKAGNVPEPAEIPPPDPDPEPVVPRQVTMRQARLALLDAGLLSGVDAAIDSLDEPHRSAARIEWEYAQAVERYSPLTEMLGAAIGLTSEAIDALFFAAEGR